MKSEQEIQEQLKLYIEQAFKNNFWDKNTGKDFYKMKEKMIKEIDKLVTNEAIRELQTDLEHFKETEKTRELNSFEQGIKEEIERILKDEDE